MSDQKPDPCPNPMRSCPMDESKIDDRLKAVEEAMSKQTRERELHAEHVIKAVQEVQLSLRNYEDYISAMNKRMEKVEDLIGRVVILMEGTMGRQGMVGEQADFGKRIKTNEKDIQGLKDWQSGMHRTVLVLGAVCTALGSGIAWAVNLIFGK